MAFSILYLLLEAGKDGQSMIATVLLVAEKFVR
jgi:hypothetical protein